MSDSASALADMQASDYALTGDIGLQDYSDLTNNGLDAPTFDTPMGVDPFSGASIYDGNPTAPSLTEIGTPAGDGTNGYNDGLLPLSNPNPVSDAVIAASQYSGVSMSTDANLPLSALSTGAKTALGVATIAPPAVSQPMGASLWASLFGTGASATTTILGSSKAGTAGSPNAASKAGGLTGIKAAPPTAMGNPISGTSTALIIGVVASLIGIVLWSFSGGR